METVLLILKLLLFILLFLQVYQMLISLRSDFNKDIQEAKNAEYISKKPVNNFITYIEGKYKNNTYYLKINDYLLKAGNPLNLTPTTYMIFKLVLTLIIPLYAYMNYKNFQMTLLGFLTGFFVIDVLIMIEKRNRAAQIISDLPDVVDSLKIQVLSGIPLNSAVLELHKIPKNKNFREHLKMLAARYSITKDMSSAVAEFRKNFDMVEIEGLCLTLEQNETTGSSLGLLENQSQILQANYIFKIQKDTKKKEYLVIICMILVLINIASIILYPIISQINQSLKTIFS